MTPDPLIGTELAGYRLVSHLGRGGMGVVYRAENGPRDVIAIKVIAPELARSSEFRERFLREGDSALDHPHIVPLYCLGDEDSHLFLKMLLVEGCDLKRLIAREGPLRPTRVASLLSQAAEALDFAHGHGLVHRDIKSQNLLIESPGERDHLYVTDFGLVKRVSSESSFTSSGHVVGSAPYMSPEQIRGIGVDGRTDVYALGCVLYECLTGVPPYRRDEEVSVMWAHVNEPIPRPSDEVGTLSEGIDEIVAKSMAKDPDERYLTAGDLAAAVSEELGVSGVKGRSSWVAKRVAPITPRSDPLRGARVAPTGRPGWSVRGLVAGLTALVLTGVVAGAATRSPDLPPNGSRANAASAEENRPSVASGRPPQATTARRGKVSPRDPRPTGSGIFPSVSDVSFSRNLVARVLHSAALQTVVPENSALARSRIIFASNRRYFPAQRGFHGSFDLFTMRADGLHLINLSSFHPDRSDIFPAISACGHYAFMHYDPSTAPRDSYTLFTLDRHGNRLFGDDTWNGSRLVDWSPHCNGVLFGTPEGIVVMDPDGSDRRLIFEAPSPAHARWSPDGAKIAFDMGTFGEESSDIYVANADGGELTRLTSASDWDTKPVWSPDGSKIAFRRGAALGSGGDGDIWIMNADGSGQQRLTSAVGDDIPITWSPDGRYIVFFSDRETPRSFPASLQGDVYVMTADGNNERDLIPDAGGEENWLAWQPAVYRTVFARATQGELSGRLRAIHRSCERNQRVNIERYESNGWRFLGSTTTSAGGRFSALLPEPGRYRARLTLTNGRGGLLCGLATSRSRESL